MDRIAELLTYPFMQRALIASLIVGVVCPLIGGFVVLRRMAFFSDAISHSAFAGIAIGSLLGIDLSVSSVMVALSIALIIAYLSGRTRLSHDTIIGVAFSGTIATGILILAMFKGYRAQLFTFLFGDILAITRTDLILISVVGVCCITIMLCLFKPFIQITFHRDLAQVGGINVRFFEYLFFLITALVITVSLKLIGIILVTSLLIVPAASAKNIASSIKGFFALSCIFGLISGITGLILSIYLNTPAGPSIVLVSISIFILTLALSRFD